MTYQEAMQFIRDNENEFKKVRRPGWNRNLGVNQFYYYDAINDVPDRAPTMWDLDNGEGSTSGRTGSINPPKTTSKPPIGKYMTQRSCFPVYR